MSVNIVSRLKSYPIFALFTLFFLCAKGNWTPQIVTYSRIEYKAGSQNWQIAQRNNHWIYFANKAGILEFNGLAWTLYPFDNSADGRSLLFSADNRRLYVGSINEFGYLEPDETGILQYTNLSVNMPREEMNIGNVWKIYEVDNTIYFCGDHMVVCWRDGSFHSILSPDKIDCSELIKNTLFIGTTSGLYVLAGEGFYPVPNTAVLKKKS